MHSLLDFARDLTRITVAAELAKHEALEEACRIVEDEAKRVIGTYDYGWPQLAEATQEDRARKGYAPNDPLLREGDLRDSISHEVDGDAGYVGSPMKIALWQELGTSKIPARSFLGGAGRAKEAEIHLLGAKAAYTALTKTLTP